MFPINNMFYLQMKTVIIAGTTAVALYLVYNRKEKFMSKDNEDFREGYVAGFLTPGPFTILAIAGLASFV